jgi:hypothetical protein
MQNTDAVKLSTKDTYAAQAIRIRTHTHIQNSKAQELL